MGVCAGCGRLLDGGGACRRCPSWAERDAPAPAPPAGAAGLPPQAGPPEPPGDAGQGGLTIRELGYLKQAGRWGLLRRQAPRRFLLTGSFSMPARDLAALVEAAGGQVAPAWPQGADAVDVVVCGQGGSADLTERAYEEMVPVWDEAELVLELVPSWRQLTAAPGEPPF